MLYQSFFSYFNIYQYKDFIEILFFSSAFYYISLWLQRDKQKNILGWFYGYCSLIIATKATTLLATHYVLLVCFPLTFICLIVLHQELLQRNFVMHQTIKPARVTDYDWMEQLIRNCLMALNNHKGITGIIERNDRLNNLLETNSYFNCDLSDGLLEIIFASSLFKHQKLLWINDKGKLIALNSDWKQNSIETWLAQEVKEQDQWLQNALFFTTKTDALIFRLNPEQRTFTLIARGKIIEHVSASTALKTIKTYLGHNHPSLKGEPHATSRKTASTEQSFT